MSTLISCIDNLRANLDRHQKRDLKELPTRTIFIDPLLAVKSSYEAYAKNWGPRQMALEMAIQDGMKRTPGGGITPEIIKTLKFVHEQFLLELIHFTGHPKRLHRFEIDTPLDGREKSEEELTVELGMIFICAYEGLPCDKTNSAAYCLGWAGWLREHPKAMVFAAFRAD